MPSAWETRAAEAEALLRRLVEKDPVEATDGALGIYFCGYCDGRATYDRDGMTVVEHRPDCPHVAARAWLAAHSERDEG